MKQMLMAVCLVAACASVPKETSPQLGYTLPAQHDVGFTRVFCEELVSAKVAGCGYVGWYEGELCMGVLESDDGEKWELKDWQCGVKVLIFPPMKSMPKAPPQEK